MSISWNKHFPAIIYLVFLLNVSEVTSTELVEEDSPCSNECSESTVNPTGSSTAETTLTEILISTSTEGKTEVTTATDGNDEAEVTSSADASTASSKDVDGSTTSKPKKPFSSTTSVSPAVTTNKIPTLAPKIVPSNRTSPFGDFCPCDLKVNSCDINCCCDVKDCTEKEQEVFSHCIPLPAASPDPRLCRQYKWVSTPNHTLKLEAFYNQSSLLCINRDNNPRRLALQDQKPIDSVEDFRVLVERKVVYKWPTPITNDPQININSSYKAGDILWAVQNMTLYPLSFLTSGFNTVCQSRKWIRFLNDWESSCTLPLPYMPLEDNSESSPDLSLFQEGCSKFSAYEVFKKLVLLTSPQLWFNVSSNVCPPEVCVNTQQWICSSQSFVNCHKAEEVPRAQLKGETCTNMLHSVRLVVNVVGVNIHSAQVYFLLSDTTFSSQIPAVSRKHSVAFNWWSNEDDIGSENDKDRAVWRRSGNPGYILGRPVMAGWKETVVLGGEDLKQREDGIESGILEGIRVTPDPNSWLTVLGPEGGGPECGGERRAIQFGYSARWSCSIPLFRDDFTAEGCANLKKRVLGLLLGWGSIGNLSERYIATFGDSSPEKVSEWVPLKIISSDEKKMKDIFSEKVEQPAENKIRKQCFGLHSSIHLELATALVGSVANPQAKVVGAILSLGREIDVRPHRLWISWYPETSGVTKTETISGESKPNENKGKNNKYSISKGTEGSGDDYQRKYLMLVTSVKFIDVTGPPVMEVAPPPVYHIRLPYEFFHPFLSVAPSLSYHALVLFWSSLTMFLLQ